MKLDVVSDELIGQDSGDTETLERVQALMSGLVPAYRLELEHSRER